MSFEGQKGPTLGMRHMQALLLFLDMVAIYVSRLNIGVAVVAMTNADTTNPDFPEYDWDEKKISYILSSYYLGYILTLFPGGIVCKRYGAKMVIGWATFISGALCAVTPWCVGWGGWQAFCTIRILLGLSQGPVFTSIFEHLAKWSPLQERNRLGAFSHTGLDCGTVMAMGISGIIAEGSMGWPGISYVCAAMCFAWCMLWLSFAANNPCESRFITEAEKLYIESSMDHGDDFHKKKIPIPWKAIFTSVPTLTLVILRSAQKWGIATFESQIPLYMNGLLNMDIKSNALYSSLPFIASWAMSYVFLLLADVLEHKQVLSLTAIRKVFSSIASWIPAIGLIGIGFLDEDWKNLAVALMAVAQTQPWDADDFLQRKDVEINSAAAQQCSNDSEKTVKAFDLKEKNIEIRAIKLK